MGTGKRASFAENDEDVYSIVCTLPNREELTEEDICNLWFSKEEYQLTRTHAKTLCRDKDHFELSRHLDDTFSSKRSKEAQARLEQWVAKSEDIRGLERWTNRRHGDVRLNEQFRAVMAVLDAQSQMICTQQGVLDWEKLRKVYNTESRAARLYARMMGKADSMVLKLDGRQPTDNGEDDETDAWTVDTANTTKSDPKQLSVSPTKRVSSKLPAYKIDELKDSVHEGRTFRIFRPFSPRKKSLKRNKGV